MARIFCAYFSFGFLCLSLSSDWLDCSMECNYVPVLIDTLDECP